MAYLKGDVESKGVKGHKLTPKMLSFIDAYFGPANFNATKAYGMSDYKSNGKSDNLNAAELMNHPLVRKEIERRTAQRTERAEVKAEYLINKLMQIIERTEEDNPQAALRAIELAGKSIAMWKERQEITGADGAAIQHEQHVKESVADFTSRISSLAKRNGTDNVVEFPERGGAG
jgi:phage terminase small subunit